MPPIREECLLAATQFVSDVPQAEIQSVIGVVCNHPNPDVHNFGLLSSEHPKADIQRFT